MNRLERYIDTKTNNIMNEIKEGKIIFISGKYGKTSIVKNLLENSKKTVIDRKVSSSLMELIHSTRLMKHQIPIANRYGERMVDTIVVELSESHLDLAERAKVLIDLLNITSKMNVCLILTDTESVEKFKALTNMKMVKSIELRYVEPKNKKAIISNVEVIELEKEKRRLLTEIDFMNEIINYQKNNIEELEVQNTKKESEIELLNSKLKEDAIDKDCAIHELKHDIKLKERIISSLSEENKNLCFHLDLTQKDLKQARIALENEIKKDKAKYNNENILIMLNNIENEVSSLRSEFYK